MVNCSLKFLFWVIFVSISQSSIFCALNLSCQIRKFLFFFRGSVGVWWLNQLMFWVPQQFLFFAECLPFLVRLGDICYVNVA